MPLVAGVDSSTQSTKVELRDADTGTLVSRGRAPHPVVTPPKSEQDPAAWWDALGAAFNEAAGGLPGGRADAIVAVSVAGQQHGLVVLDGVGAVVRPAKLWNDTESAPDASWLVEQLGGPERWAQACGSVPVASFTITKLSWLHRSEPDAWARLATVLLPHDWLTYRLTGEFVTDRGDASGTGYWSPRDEQWRTDLLAIVDRDRDWTQALPRVLGPTDAAGAARKVIAGLDGVVVGPGTGDNMAAALGLGLATGDVAVSIGTSGTVFARSAGPPAADRSGAVAGFADATGAYLPLVCTLNAARVTDAMAAWLGVGGDAFDRMATAAEPGAGGVVLVPYFDGERTPNLPDATGALAGLRTGTTREQLARAAVEGVVCSLLDGLDALAAVGTATDGGALHVTGGGARGDAYPQVLADLTGRPVTVARDAEDVARGACIQAAAVAHGARIDDLARAWAPATRLVVEPRIDAAQAAEVRARYRHHAARPAGGSGPRGAGGIVAGSSGTDGL